MDRVSVKEYAAVISRSESTVYRMIKKGTLDAKKGKKGLEIVVDLSQFKCHTKQCREIKKLKKEVKELKAKVASDKKTAKKQTKKKSDKKSNKKR